MRCSSSRCQAEGTREYARVDIKSTVVPSRRTTDMQKPPQTPLGAVDLKLADLLPGHPDHPEDAVVSQAIHVDSQASIPITAITRSLCGQHQTAASWRLSGMSVCQPGCSGQSGHGRRRGSTCTSAAQIWICSAR
jgi:hypothetical protein